MFTPYVLLVLQGSILYLNAAHPGFQKYSTTSGSNVATRGSKLPPITEISTSATSTTVSSLFRSPDEGKCEDSLPNCRDYSDEACDGIFRNWAVQNCAERCGYCQDTTACDDYYDCDALPGHICNDTMYERFALRSCRKFCGLCSADSKMGLNECELDLHNCDLSHATCIDTPEGYECVCNRGYDGDGRTCHKSATCHCNGDPHCSSFDNRWLHFQGKCQYIMTQDGCSSANASSFKIVAEFWKRNQFAKVSYVKSLTITTKSEVVRLLLGNTVKVDGQLVQLPYVKANLSIYSNLGDVVFRTDSGIHVRWNGRNFRTSISVPSTFSDQLCGLCGNYNGNITDDWIIGPRFQDREGNFTDNELLFGDSWAVDDFTKDNLGCKAEKPDICTQDEMKNSKASCMKIFDTNGTFSECLKSLDNSTVENLFTSCTYDICHTGDVEGTLCDLSNVMSKDICLQYFSSKNRVLLTKYFGCKIDECELDVHDCDRNNANCLDTDNDFECVCKSGYEGDGKTCVESATCSCLGDPHCSSFDNRWLRFQGDCQYVLATDGCYGSRETFVIQAEFWHRLNPSVAYVKNVRIIFNSTKVDLLVGNRVLLNGLPVSLPYGDEESEISLSLISRDVVFHSNTGVRVRFDGIRYAMGITIPATMKGSVCGLCGNYNGNLTDDWTIGPRFPSMSGNITGDQMLFGDSYVVTEYLNNHPGCVSKEPSSCNKDKRMDAEIKCNKLLNSTGIFGECIRNLDLATLDGLLSSCAYDICHTGEEKETICDMANVLSKEKCAEYYNSKDRILITRNFGCEINECQLGLHDCHETLANCIDTESGYECACKKGYQGDGRSCIEIGTCSCVGETHCRTFDNKWLQFQGDCPYIMVADSCAVNPPSFAVHAHISHDGDPYTAIYQIFNVTVLIKGITVNLFTGRDVFVDGKVTTLPYTSKDNSFIVTNDTLESVLEISNGIKVIWNGQSMHLSITIPASQRNKVCGMCGNYNGDSTDDWSVGPRYKAEFGQITTDQEKLWNSYVVPDMPSVYPSCPKIQRPLCTKSWLHKAELECKKILNDSSVLGNCISSLDTHLMKDIMDSCVKDICRKQNIVSVICSTAREITHNLCPEMYSSRDKILLTRDFYCDVDECSLGYHDCHPDHATCNDIKQGYECTCNDGYRGDGRNCIEVGECYCWGDPHCKSFDGKWLHFQGRCQYIMSTDGCHGKNSTFAVYARYYDYGNAQSPVTYVTNVTVISEDNVKVDLLQHGAVLVDGASVVAPVKKSNISIVKTTEYTVVSLTNGVEVYWNGYWTMRIILPATMKNSLCGLCGDFNGNMNNEWTVGPRFPFLNGNITSDLNVFGDSYVVPEYLSDSTQCRTNTDGACTAADIRTADAACDKIFGRNSVYDTCLQALTKDEFEGLRTSCSYDVCHARDQKQTVCDMATHLAHDVCSQYFSSIDRIIITKEFNCHIDECALGIHDCNKDHGTCLDTNVGFECECNQGYLGDGRTCIESATCSCVGDGHCSTFDQRWFPIRGYGQCQYTMVEYVSQNKNESFRVKTKFSRPGDKSWANVEEIAIDFDFVEIKLRQNKGVLVDGAQTSLPYMDGLPIFSLKEDKSQVILTTLNDVQIHWDGRHYFSVVVPSTLKGHVSGICGNYNGDKLDDQRVGSRYTKIMNQYTSNFTIFWDSNINHDNGQYPVCPVIEDPSCSTSVLQNAKATCRSLLNATSVFQECFTNLGNFSTDIIYSNCVTEMCRSRSVRTIYCNTAKYLTQQICPQFLSTTERALISKDFYCEIDECSLSLDDCDPDHGTCIDIQGGYECVCNDGYRGNGKKCVEVGECYCWGDPHCKSFDGKWLHFQGHCQYVLSTDGCGGNPRTFAVYAHYWDHGNPTAYVRYVRNVTVLLDANTTVDLLQGREIRINGQPAYTPIQTSEFSITQDHPYVVLSTMSGIEVRWTGTHIVRILLPATLRSSICGLCGDFNGNMDNDWTVGPMIPSLQGNITTDLNVFGDSYLVSSYLASHPDCRTKDANACSVTDTKEAEKRCDEIFALNGVFSQCLKKMEKTKLDGLRSSCIFDICHADNDNETICGLASLLLSSTCASFFSSTLRILLSKDFYCDINECQLNLHDCDTSYGICLDTKQGFTCSCMDDYEGDGRNCKKVKKDCKDIIDEAPDSSSGIYNVRLPNSTQTVQVECDMEIDGGGWTVFQRRMDGSVDFHRNWTEYKNGFGNLSGEFWLGNDILYRMTSNLPYTLKIELEDWENNTIFENYANFVIDGEDKFYTLHVSGYSGPAGDILEGHDGCKFSASDSDNDNIQIDCANYFLGGWWYNNCFKANLNGPYRHTDGKLYSSEVALSTYKWKGPKYSLKGTRMMMRHK